MLKINPKLRRILSKLYYQSKDIQRFASDAGVEMGKNISWEGKAVNIWFDVLKVCMAERDKFIALLESIRFDKPNIKFFKQVEKFYASGSSDLIESLEKIKLVGLPEIGPIDLYNCGRTKESNDFWKPHDLDLANVPLLTGLLLGNDDERPVALAKRLVYEYLQIMESEEKMVLYKRGAENFEIKSISIDAKTDKSLEWTIDQYLTEFIGQGALEKYGAIAHILEVNIAESINVLEQIAATAIDKFTSFAKTQKTHNLLMLVFRFNAAVDITELEQTLSRISKKGEHVTYISKLGPVNNTEIKDWFVRLGAQNTEGIKSYFNQFIEDEIEEKVVNPIEESNGSWPMEKVLLVQDQVFQYAMKKDVTNKGPEDV